MARSHAARHRPRPVPGQTLTRRLARYAAGVAIVATSAVLPLAAGAAHAQPDGPGQAPASPFDLSVTSMTPAYARPGQTITVTGQVKNTSKAELTSLSIQLYSSRVPLSSQGYLDLYATGAYRPPQQSPLAIGPLTLPRLGAGHTWRWKVTVPASALPMSCFGVYPLTAYGTDAAGDIGRDPVPLPFWPTGPSTRCSAQRQPSPLPVSWVWPLIDTPRLSPCHGTLLNDGLARQLAPGGRLSTLLAAGTRFTSSARLTWAIDPALLDAVRTMKRPYAVSDAVSCQASVPKPASQAAASWLSGLVKATSGQTVFVTPYADVDVAALAEHGGPDLKLAYANGNQVAHQVLGRTTSAGGQSGKRTLAPISWPADGVGSTALLDSLAVPRISTVILAMPASPQVPYTPGAVTNRLTIGKNLSILLADHSISGLLGAPAAASRSASDVFSVSQRFLADTAMIGAEEPGLIRPIVVTPPRRWDPSAKLATDLLADTVNAPWLRPSTTGQLVTMKPEHVYGKLPLFQSRKQIPAELLRRITTLDRRVELLKGIRVGSDPLIYRTVFGAESSAWRGSRAGTKHAHAMLARAARFVEGQLHGLTLGDGRKRQPQEFVTLGGKVGTILVTIDNALGYRVRVGLQAQSVRTVVKGLPETVQIPARSNVTVKLSVRTTSSQAGEIRVLLTCPPGRCGSSGVPLPAPGLTIHVEPTDFGTVALLICAAALAVFVIASAARAIRAGRPEPDATAGPDDPSGPVGPAGPAGSADAAGAYVAAEAAGPAGRADFADHHDRGEYPDTVFPDPPELTSAGQAAHDQDLTAPVRRPTEER